MWEMWSNERKCRVLELQRGYDDRNDRNAGTEKVVITVVKLYLI